MRSNQNIRYGGYFLHQATSSLVGADGRATPLRPRTLAVFKCLVAKSGKIVTKQELMKAAWPGLVVTDDSITQCIADIRRAVNDRQRFILKTVHRQGYCLSPDDLSTPSMPAIQDEQLNNRKPTPGKPTNDPLVGRQNELRLLNDAVREARAGSNNLVLVVGEAGIGKTRLNVELFERLMGARMVCAQSQCYPLGSDLGYVCLATWLRDEQISRNLSQLNEDCRREVSRILPELAEYSTQAPAKPVRTEPWNKVRFFAAIYCALTVTEEPLVLMLDNLQWCDTETVQLLSYALQQAKGPGIAVIASVRNQTELAPESSLLVEQMVRSDHFGCVELGPLSRAESVRLAAALSSSWKESMDSGSLYKFSGGNPLFITEAVRSIANTGGSIGTVPGRLNEAIDFRLSLLSSSALRVLRCAAAIRPTFGAELVAKSLETDLCSVEQELEVLTQGRFLEPHAQGHAFTHDLLREAVYRKVDEDHRRQIHHGIARAICSLDLVNGESHASLAMHYAQAGLYAEAMQQYRHAACHARKQHANHAELGALRGAIAMLEKLDASAENQCLRIETLLDLGLAESAVSGWGASTVGQAWEGAYELSLEAGTVELKARAINALDTWFRDSGQWHRSEIVSEAAQDLLPELNDAYLRLCLQSAHGALLLHTGRPKASLDQYDQVIAESNEQIVPSFNWFNSTFTVGAYFRSAMALWLLGKTKEAHARSIHALDLSAQRSDPFHRVITLFHVAMLYEFERDTSKVLELSDEMSHVALRYDYGFYRSSAVLFNALAQLRSTGDPKELALVENITNQQHIAGTRMFEPYWQANLAEGYLIVGEVKQARRTARQALNRSSRTHNQYWDAGLWTIIGQSLQAEFAASSRSQDAFENAIHRARRQGSKQLEARAIDAMRGAKKGVTRRN